MVLGAAVVAEAAAAHNLRHAEDLHGSGRWRLVRPQPPRQQQQRDSEQRRQPCQQWPSSASQGHLDLHCPASVGAGVGTGDAAGVATRY